MTMAIKNQQRIHKAFARKLNEKSREVYDKLISEHPELAASIAPKSTDEADAIADSNFAICEYFYVKSQDRKLFDFGEQIRSKEVWQVARANVLAYKGISESLEEETDAEYKGVYSRLASAYRAYFAIAAEDCLKDVYGKKYSDFAEEYNRKAEEAKAEKESK